MILRQRQRSELVLPPSAFLISSGGINGTRNVVQVGGGADVIVVVMVAVYADDKVSITSCFCLFVVSANDDNDYCTTDPILKLFIIIP